MCTCDQDETRGDCNYHTEGACDIFPYEWGKYCSYEFDFIQDRYEDLAYLFSVMKDYYETIGVDGFTLNHTKLWEVCFIYANDLKPVRKFHDVEGGCDEMRRAAFLARLIALHKPIQIAEFIIPDTTNKQSAYHLQINQHFALHALCYFLEVPSEIFANKATISKMAKVRADLIFIFSHRDPQPESLVCIARLLSILSGH